MITINTQTNRLLFCPRCHRRVESPIKGQNNIKISGNLTIMCNYCKKGKIIIKGEKNA